MLERILYVEDEIGIQEIARMALEHIGGYQVKVCSSGREALEHVPKFKPQLVLLDVMMPQMDGMETYIRLRKLPETQSVPVVFLTAKSMKEELHSLRALRASGIICKPFDPMELPQLVRTYWENAQMDFAEAIAS